MASVITSKLPAKFLQGSGIRWGIQVGLFLLLTSLIVATTIIYISQERNVHWWVDWHHRTVEIVNAWQISPQYAIRLIQDSLKEERNRLFTLPLLPFMVVFGQSRLVYEVALSLVYLLPFSLVMGAISTQIIPVYRPAIFWFTSYLTLFVPVTWISTFMGLPDTGGAVFIGLAIFLYLQDYKLQHYWRIPAIGISLACAILLRRHFSYGAIAFFAALGYQTLFITVQNWKYYQKQAWQIFIAQSFKVVLIGMSFVATLMLMAGEFTYRAMTTNYQHFYASWSLPYFDTLQLYPQYYGWATILIAVLGVSIGLMTQATFAPSIHFLTAFGLVSAIIWMLVLRYGNIFYTVHLNVWIIIGLVAFLWTAFTRLRGQKRTFILSLTFIYLVLNFVLGITPIGKWNNPLRPLFSLSNPPLVQTDYDEVIRLVKDLRNQASDGEPIFVAGFQRLHLSEGRIKSMERVLYPPYQRFLNLIPTPKVDSLETYPLPELLQAKYVVVPNKTPDYPGIPWQVPAVGEWLPNQELDLVKVVLDAFHQNWEIAQDFRRLPQEYQLDYQSTASVYQRIRPTSTTTAIKTLNAIQKQMGSRGRKQPDWFNLSDVPGRIEPETLQSYRLGNGLNGLHDRHATTFIYIGRLFPQTQVTGTFTNTGFRYCQDVTLKLSAVDSQGRFLNSQIWNSQLDPRDRFNFQLSHPEANYLLLELLDNQGKPLDNCTVQINHLTVSPAS